MRTCTSSSHALLKTRPAQQTAQLVAASPPLPTHTQNHHRTKANDGSATPSGRAVRRKGRRSPRKVPKPFAIWCVRSVDGGVLRPPPPPQEDRGVEETSRDGFTLPYVGIRRMYTGDFSRGPVQTFKPMPSSKQSYELVWPRGGGTS